VDYRHAENIRVLVRFAVDAMRNGYLAEEWVKIENFFVPSHKEVWQLFSQTQLRANWPEELNQAIKNSGFDQSE